MLLTLCAGVVSLLAPGLATARTAPGTFLGADGLLYHSAPLVLNGLDDQMFYGPELDLACGVGDRLAVPMKAVSRLARVIEKSGRKVVFSIAPGKSATMEGELGQLPHGVCDQQGLVAQNRVLDGYDDPAYLPLRHHLTGTSRQLYWKTDLHWTTAGGAEYAKALATRLDPGLGRRQRFRYGTETRVGLLSELRRQPGCRRPRSWRGPPGRSRCATPRARRPGPATPSSRSTTPGSPAPARLTWPGRTLLLGDSFMWYALENLRPIFQRGEFIWFVVADDDKFLANAIKKADTVVIEIYQMVTPGTPLASPAFRRHVKHVLNRSGS